MGIVQYQVQQSQGKGGKQGHKKIVNIKQSKNSLLINANPQHVMSAGDGNLLVTSGLTSNGNMSPSYPHQGAIQFANNPYLNDKANANTIFCSIMWLIKSTVSPQLCIDPNSDYSGKTTDAI